MAIIRSELPRLFTSSDVISSVCGLCNHPNIAKAGEVRNTTRPNDLSDKVLLAQLLSAMRCLTCLCTDFYLTIDDIGYDLKGIKVFPSREFVFNPNGASGWTSDMAIELVDKLVTNKSESSPVISQLKEGKGFSAIITQILGQNVIHNRGVVIAYPKILPSPDLLQCFSRFVSKKEPDMPLRDYFNSIDLIYRTTEIQPLDELHFFYLISLCLDIHQCLSLYKPRTTVEERLNFFFPHHPFDINAYTEYAKMIKQDCQGKLMYNPVFTNATSLDHLKRAHEHIMKWPDKYHELTRAEWFDKLSSSSNNKFVLVRDLIK